MSVRKAAAVFGVGRTSIEDRRRGKVAMNAKVGPETILSKEEEDSLEDVLLFSARNYLAVDRVHLRDAVRRPCNDGRRIPWDPEKGGERLACGLPSWAPTAGGALDPHLRGKQDHRRRGASHGVVLREMGSSPRRGQTGGQPRAQHGRFARRL
ncbi:unnamed protein product [Pylaiella littoralis]